MFNNDRVRFHHADDHDHGDLGGHDHNHPHVHKSIGESRDEKTLNMLLDHWINHNKSHEEEFKEWVDKAKSMEKYETANSIEKAIEYLQKSNEMLSEAKNICNKF